MHFSTDEAKLLKDQFRNDFQRKKQVNNLLKYILSFDKLSAIAMEASSFKELGEILLGREELPKETKLFIDLALTFDYIIYALHIR